MGLGKAGLLGVVLGTLSGCSWMESLHHHVDGLVKQSERVEADQCTLGGMQSPIHVLSQQTLTPKEPLDFELKLDNTQLTMMQLNKRGLIMETTGGQLRWGNEPTFLLYEVVLTLPNNHKVDDVDAKAELVLIFKNELNRQIRFSRLLVIEADNLNKDLAGVIDDFPPQANELTPLTPGVHVQVKNWLSNLQHYFFYEGSSLNPPCTQGIRWVVDAQPLKVSPFQIIALRRLMFGHGGQRPLQATSTTRLVLEVGSESSAGATWELPSAQGNDAAPATRPGAQSGGFGNLDL